MCRETILLVTLAVLWSSYSVKGFQCPAECPVEKILDFNNRDDFIIKMKTGAGKLPKFPNKILKGSGKKYKHTDGSKVVIRIKAATGEEFQVHSLSIEAKSVKRVVFKFKSQTGNPHKFKHIGSTAIKKYKETFSQKIVKAVIKLKPNGVMKVFNLKLKACFKMPPTTTTTTTEPPIIDPQER